MIQRKQSLFLLLSIVAFVASYFLPFGEFSQHALYAYHAKDTAGTDVEGIQHYWFHAPYALASLIALASIFMFNNRVKQMAVLRLSFILYAASFALMAFYIRSASGVLNDKEFMPGISFFLVFISFVLNMLALRAIKKDELLVRSVDRIR
jgi:hypothetical protein